MGWDYFRPPAGKSTRDILHDELPGITCSTQIGRTVYAAFRTSSGEVLGLVVLTDRRGGQFGYKLISEDMGPCESDCPAAILNLLSNPAPNDWARAWRERCRAKHAAAADELADWAATRRAWALVED